MKLTKKKAIELTLKMWRDLAETGETKGDWFREHDEYEGIFAGCFLCAYVIQKRKGCWVCSFHEKFGWCDDPNTPYNEWNNGRTPKTRKKYAALFVRQLEQL